MEVSIDNLVARIGENTIPVLETTINDLRRKCAQDNTLVADLQDIVDRDPGLVIYLLRVGNSKTTGSLRSDITTVQQSLMMLGLGQVSALPEKLPALEKVLEEPAITRLLKTFARAYHAASQATAWAQMRRDMNPEEVFTATQLHFLGEMFVAIYYPQLLDQIDVMSNEKNIASEEAQFIVLGFTLDQLTAKLARLWSLPSLLLDALHPENAKFPRAYGIMLAVQLARGAAINWYSEKTREIQEQAAKWLNKDTDLIINETHKTAVNVANKSALYKVRPTASYLPLIHYIESTVADTDNKVADICLMPQIYILKKLATDLSQPTANAQSAYELISMVLKGLHDGIGLNRVVFAQFEKESNSLKAEKIIGVDNDPLFSRFEISLNHTNLFSHLMKKTQAILINDNNRDKYWKMVPEEFQHLIKTNSFVAMSIYLNDMPLGLIYADRHNSSCQIDKRSYKLFKNICSSAEKVLTQCPRVDFRHN